MRIALVKSTNLRTMEKTLDSMEVGDIIIIGNDERAVLGTVGQVVFLSDRSNHDETGTFYTVSEMKKGGFTIKGSGPVRMTVAEIAEKLGHEVEVVK